MEYPVWSYKIVFEWIFQAYHVRTINKTTATTKKTSSQIDNANQMTKNIRVSQRKIRRRGKNT